MFMSSLACCSLEVNDVLAYCFSTLLDELYVESSPQQHKSFGPLKTFLTFEPALLSYAQG